MVYHKQMQDCGEKNVLEVSRYIYLLPTYQANAVGQWMLCFTVYLCLGTHKEMVQVNLLVNQLVCSVWVMDRAKTKRWSVLTRIYSLAIGHVFPPLPCYGWRCSISNRICIQCWWPHSDQTGHGSICCWHYWWALHTLSQPDYTAWKQWVWPMGVIPAHHWHDCKGSFALSWGCLLHLGTSCVQARDFFFFCCDVKYWL